MYIRRAAEETLRPLSRRSELRELVDGATASLATSSGALVVSEVLCDRSAGP